jgi:UDPglucose--hexose-1-phosphate uridylyltransferase
MPELRQNIATKEWVIIATERAQRPADFADPGRLATHARPARVETCPFCPGNESMSDPAVLEVREGDRWLARIVPNKYPALVERGEVERRFDGIARWLSGFGVHEVLVESPVHNTAIALSGQAEVARALRALQQRGRQLARDPRLMMTICFQNHGTAAGTSLEHPHSQVIAVPVVPHHIRQRLADALAYFDERGTCVYCDMWRQELADGARVLEEGEHFVAFLPYAALSPFHTWILPKRHTPIFTQITEAETEDLARVLRGTLARLYWGLHDPDYNTVIRSAPSHEEHSRSFHWYLSVVPKVTRLAGFELGSGMFINTAPPEASARFLREVRLPA